MHHQVVIYPDSKVVCMSYCHRSTVQDMYPLSHWRESFIQIIDKFRRYKAARVVVHGVNQIERLEVACENELIVETRGTEQESILLSFYASCMKPS